MNANSETLLDRFGTSITPTQNGFALPNADHSRPVRHGSKLSYEELKAEAYELASRSMLTYAEIAAKLDVSENAVAKAVTRAGPKFQRLQMRIVELLSEYEVERQEHVVFRTWKKDPEANE